MFSRPGYTAAEQARRDQRAFSLYVDLTVLSDDTGNKGDGVGYQLNINPEYNLGTFGRLGGTVRLEFFDSPLRAGEVDEGALLEADFGPYWSYEFAQIGTTVQVGWLGEAFPRNSGDARFTQELYISLAFDDRKLLGTSQPLLNPYVVYYQDIDDSAGGWLEVGLFHCFFLADTQLGDTPLLKDISITPSFLWSVDNGQLDRNWTVASYRYGLAVCYDLSAGAGIPDRYGWTTITAFVYYNNDVLDPGVEDKVYGGVTFGWSW